MFTDEKLKKLSIWIISIFTICIFIYLGIRHIDQVVFAIGWLFHLIEPLLLGLILALFFNVPLGFIEKHLKMKQKRPLAIFLSMVLVFGIFIGVCLLVLPELVDAIKILVSSLFDGLDQLEKLSENYSSINVYGIDIDFVELRNNLAAWVSQFGSSLIDGVAGTLGSVASAIFNFVIGLVFSIYILANKEKLKRQVAYLIRVWMPKKLGSTLIHVAEVLNLNFKLFVAGQTMEATILGSLCVIGMLILRLPYAPMIGALVGVTALIPYVGAWIATLVGAFMIMTIDPLKALVFVIFLLALQQVEGNIIYPKVVGAKINLGAMWVLAGITIGGNIAGPFGMLLGVPIASSCYSLLKEATLNRERLNG